MGQEYSTIGQIIVKADRRKAIAWRSVSCKMRVITNLKKNFLDSQSVFCTRSAVYILYLVYILYQVWSLQSAFCTNRYPWHQYSLFLVTVIRTTHPIYHKIPVCELIRHFRYFRVNTSLTMFQVIHPPQKNNSCMHSMTLFVFLRGLIGK